MFNYNFFDWAVTLKAKKGHFFKGFFIQVRPESNDCIKSIGKFQVRRHFYETKKKNWNRINYILLLLLEIPDAFRFLTGVQESSSIASEGLT